MAASPRVAWALLAFVSLVYLVGFLLFPPKVLVISDESDYVSMAVAMAHGHTRLPQGTAFSSERVQRVVADYPPGNSLLQTPFVLLGGWRAAPLASVVSFLGTLFLLGYWIASEGFSPIFALLFFVYPPALVLGRIGLSDLPSALIITAAYLLFWRGQERHWRWWFWSGFLAGLSLLFRETNALYLLPLYVGTLVRRERKAAALIAGGLLGVAVRLGAAFLVFGQAVYVRDPVYRWALGNVAQNAPLYLIALLVFIPGGLWTALLYRGARRPELLATVALLIGFFFTYGYSGVESGTLKRLILGPRFFLPMSVWLAFAAAEVVTRLSPRWIDPGRLAAAGRWASIASSLFAAGLGLSAHFVVARWSAGQAAMVRAIYGATTDGAAIVTNTQATYKFIHPIYGDRVPVGRGDVPPERAAELLRAHPQSFVAFNDRSDSTYFFRDASANAQYLVELRKHCRLSSVLDAQEDPNNHLRIWRIESCREP